jgi:hypothetical protein
MPIGMKGLVPALVTMIVGSGASAWAQPAPRVPISQLVPAMSVAATKLIQAPASDGTDHFTSAAANLSVLADWNRAIARQVAIFPMAAAPGGVAFIGSSETVVAGGVLDQPWTRGQGRLALGVSFQPLTFDSYDELDLRDSATNLFLTHACCSNTLADRDLMQQTISLRLRRKTTAVSLVYGVSDRLDVGVTAPIVEVSADVRILARVLRTATSADPSIHQFGVGSTGQERAIDLASRGFASGEQPPEEGVLGTGSSTARGIGDIVLQGKLALLRSATQAASFSLDLNLPTGSTEDWIGAGTLRARPALLWARAGGRFALRARADALLTLTPLDEPFVGAGSADDRPFELGFGIGFDAPLAPRTRVTVDAFGRQLSNVPVFIATDTEFPSRGPGPLPSASFLAEDALRDEGVSQATLVTVAGGLRVHLSHTAVANVQLLVPIGARQGLRAAPTVVFSIDHGF